MCGVSQSSSSFKDRIDAQGEAEGAALDWFAEELGQTQFMDWVRWKALEHIAYRLRVLAHEKGEWRWDTPPRPYRFQRMRLIRRLCYGIRGKRRLSAPSDDLTTSAERRAHADQLQFQRVAVVAKIVQMGRRVLTDREAAAESGLHFQVVQRAAKSGQLRAAKIRGRWAIRARDLAEWVGERRCTNNKRAAAREQRSAVM